MLERCKKKRKKLSWDSPELGEKDWQSEIDDLIYDISYINYIIVMLFKHMLNSVCCIS